MTPPDTERRWSRIEPTDVLAIDDGALVLYEREVLRITQLAAAVFEWCREPRSEAEITRLLLEAFGPPPGTPVEQATTALLIDMQNRQLLGPPTV